MYQSRLTYNTGTIVENELTEIAPKTTKLPGNKVVFNPEIKDNIEVISSPITLINIVFDNDIFDNTDYYYTNGINIEFVTPMATLSPLKTILPKIREAQLNLFGFSAQQNIYTPTNPDIAEISVGDRPFSAFLTIGQFCNSYNFNKKLSIKSSINFGVLGPASMGGVVQSSIHNIEPIGWTNQINNSFIIDYKLAIEKSIVSNPHAELNLIAEGNIGTLFNKISGGIFFRAGSFIPVFRGQSTIFEPSAKSKKLQYWFFLSGKSNFVIYDATLQGGLFNTKNPYIISSDNINRIVVNIGVGFAIYYKKVGFELQNFYLSPEFTNAYDFRWGRIKLTFQL